MMFREVHIVSELTGRLRPRMAIVRWKERYGVYHREKKAKFPSESNSELWSMISSCKTGAKSRKRSVNTNLRCHNAEDYVLHIEACTSYFEIDGTELLEQN